MGMPVTPVWAQEDYAFYNDGTEDVATIIGSAGTQQTLNVDTVYHCRLAIGDTNGTNQPSQDLTIRWQFNHAGGGWTTVTGSTVIQFVDNANLTDGGSTTNRQPTGTGAFNTGRVYESSNESAVVYTLPTDESTSHTEVVLHFQIDSAVASNGDEILIRATHGDGTAFTNYTNADIDVSAPLTQSVGGSITATGGPKKETRVSYTGSITGAGAQTRETAVSLSGASTAAGALSSAIIKLQTVTGSITATGAITAKSIGKLVSGTSTATGNLIRSVNYTLQGTISAAGNLAKQAAKKLAGSIAGTGALATTKVILQSVSGTITATGSLIKRTGKLLTGAITSAASLATLFIPGAGGGGSTTYQKTTITPITIGL